MSLTRKQNVVLSADITSNSIPQKSTAHFVMAMCSQKRSLISFHISYYKLKQRCQTEHLPLDLQSLHLYCLIFY